jgi:hypothetical protein
MDRQSRNLALWADLRADRWWRHRGARLPPPIRPAAAGGANRDFLQA